MCTRSTSAPPLRALMARNDVDPEAVDDVIFGCVDTIGPQAGDIARNAWLAAGLPESVPGRRSTASAAPPSRRCTSQPRR